MSPHGTVRKQYEIEEYKFQYKGIKKILGFSFVNSSYFNFFICTNKELEILNFNKFSSNVVHVKKVPLSGQYLLYELQFYNILTLVGGDGTMSIIDLTKNPRTKQLVKNKVSFAQPDITDPLEDRQPARMSFSERALSFFKSSTIETEFPCREPINNKNILMLAEKNEHINDCFELNHKSDNSVYLLIIYNIPYFAYMNSKVGKLDLYQFDISKRQYLKTKITVELIPECSHAVHVVDNLLVVHNLDAQFSKIFDLSVTPITEQLCKNLPMNDRFAVDIYICDGIQAQYELEFVDEEDENIESLIIGRKKFTFIDQTVFECTFEYM